MEPHKESQARVSNKQASLVRAVAGQGVVEARASPKGVLITVAHGDQSAQVELFAGSALKLAEALLAHARRAVLAADVLAAQQGAA